MSDVLGHDCDGRPLHIGDRVVILSVEHPLGQHLVGRECSIRGPALLPDRRCDVELDIETRHRPGHYWYAWSKCLRKIDGVDTTTWDDVERVVGWRPQRQAEEA